MAQFIGKTISLISNADIRYVGVLHEINSQESTVSLRNVRSYGTEGRRGGNEIPPSDNIYEFIVFRGSDVKDLTVSDTTSTPAPAPAPAAAAAAAPQPVDPAVSQVQVCYCNLVKLSTSTAVHYLPTNFATINLYVLLPSFMMKYFSDVKLIFPRRFSVQIFPLPSF